MNNGNCDPDPTGWLKWRPKLIGIEHDRRSHAFSLTIAALLVWWQLPPPVMCNQRTEIS